MNLNDTSAENIKKVTTVWFKSVNLINQRQLRSDSETLKHNRQKAHELLKDIALWEYLWKYNWSYNIEKDSQKIIGSWDMDHLIIPFAKYILSIVEKDKSAKPLDRAVEMEALLRGLLTGYRAKRSAKALEFFLREDEECGADYFVNSRFAALLAMGQNQLAMDLISKNICNENQWKLMDALFSNGAQWKNVMKSSKKMKKMGWDLNNIPTKNNIVGHILRTNRVFYASKEECQDLIKIGVRPINLQIPCSQEFMDTFAQFEKSMISGQIGQVSKIKTTITKKM